MVIEKIIDFAVEIGKEKFNDKIDERRLKDTLSSHIERHQKYKY